MNSKYLKYKPEDFAADESFQNWVLSGEKGYFDFWNKWVNNHPEKQEEIEIAKQLIFSAKIDKNRIAEEEIAANWGSIESIIDSNRSNKSGKVRHLMSKWMKIAAAIILLLSVTSLVWIFNTKESEELFAEFVVPNGQKSCVNLPDGSTVWLNSGSKFSYSNEFGKKERVIKLEGQAYFDIKRDEERPFIVKTAYIDVEVLGTAFDVMAYPNEKVIRTSLIRGAVKILLPDNKSEKLKPNQACYYSTYSGKAYIEDVDTFEHIEWREGRISFNDETFEKIARRLERKYNVTIVFENQALLNESYTGTFNNDDTINKVLEIFRKTTEFNFKIERDLITIY